jgi:hypothetical protein
MDEEIELRYIINLSEAERHASVLALAKLSYDLPDWIPFLASIADAMMGLKLFEEFREMRLDDWVALNNIKRKQSVQ